MKYPALPAVNHSNVNLEGMESVVDPLNSLIAHAMICDICAKNPFGLCELGYSRLEKCLSSSPSQQALSPTDLRWLRIINQKPFVKTYIARHEQKLRSIGR